MSRLFCLPHHWPAVAVLFAVVVLVACTSESTPAPDASSTRATSSTSATLAVSPPGTGYTTATATTASAPSQPQSSTTSTTAVTTTTSLSIAELGLAIDLDTRWGDVFETLTPAEQSCIRDELGAGLEGTLAHRIVEGYSERWEVTVFACLTPGTARAVFLDVLVAGMAADDVELDAAGRACLRATVAGADIADVMAAEYEGDPAFFEFAGDLLACMPDVFLDLFLLGTGLDAAGLAADERACLLGVWDTRDWVALSVGDEAAIVTFAVDLYGCVPAFFLSGVVGEEVTLSEADAACLRAVFASLDATELVAAYEGDTNTAWAAFGEILSCVPGLVLDNAFGAELDLEPSEAEAACLRESFARLDWDGRRVVTPDTEVVAEMVRCVPDLLLLVTLGQVGAGLRDVSDDELACMREWAAGLDAGEQLLSAAWAGDAAAAETGERFFACAPHLLVPDAGDYDLVPDAGDYDTPVAITVGARVEGELDFPESTHVFAFEAERGVLYQIDVSPGTLTDPVVLLYDSDWTELDFSDDYGDSMGARIYWEATYSGTHYIEVGGYGSGSYTLTVTAR